MILLGLDYKSSLYSHCNVCLQLQTNVYRNAQERKIKYFESFVHKAEVVVPPHHELRRRTGLKNEEMGGPLPDDVINAMKGELTMLL